MDADPTVEPELDTFSLILPLPYRIALIFVLGIWAWALNLHYLSLLKIDVPALIKYHSRGAAPANSHHQRTYQLAALATLPLIGSLLFFWLVTHGQPKLVLAWEWLPQSYLFLLFLFFAVPLPRWSHTGRSRFLATLRRVSLGGIAESQDGKFGDILLADVLTSYAKVLGDLFVSICMFFSSGISSTGKPDRACGGQYMVPLIISIPSIIRLRQCLIEFGRVQRASRGGKGGEQSSGWGGQHLANALKYSSAFPVVIFSALQRNNGHGSLGVSEAGLFRLWLLSVFINSLYSFYWDVAKDWDLTLFSPSHIRNSPEHPWALRRTTQFHSPNMYYTAIVFDFVLRMTWSLKLSPHLDHWNDLEGGIFGLEVLEVARRWMWIFFRVETEWVRTNKGPPPQEILLSDFEGRFVDDED